MNHPRRLHRIIPLLGAISVLSSSALGSPGDDEAEVATAPSPVLLPAEDSVTIHEIEKNGEKIRYRATAGTLPLFNESDGEVRARIFYVSYEKLEPGHDAPQNSKAEDSAAWSTSDPATRPVTFCFNGGPGSSSVWLHLGAWGPRRVEMGDAGDLSGPPWRLVDNEATLLDRSDLVFIDPVTTGYSRASDGVDHHDFHGLERDGRAVAEFIRLWTTRNDRWGSPKFIAGESYGTTRAAWLADELQGRHGMFLDGVVLISSVLDFGTVRFNRNNILSDVLYLPTYAATGWYHGKVDREAFPSMESVVDAAEAFAMEKYMPALAAGTTLPADQRAEVVAGLSRLTGLDEAFIEEWDLRLWGGPVQKELLRDQRETVGRLDSRFKGRDVRAAGQSPDYDPSMEAIRGPYTATLNDYVRRELDFKSDLPYEILTGRVHPWDYSRWENRYVDVAPDLRSAMVRNPDLRVFHAGGWYDMATPPFAADWVFDHMELEPEDRDRIERAYYPAGHMMYVHDESRTALDRDLGAFYDRTISDQ
ncbi:MAG: peptidase S10 [Planctomycetaceae bacterium]|nr:peptidase S10 [Planctomycetaceae bacterium]